MESNSQFVRAVKCCLSTYSTNPAVKDGDAVHFGEHITFTTLPGAGGEVRKQNLAYLLGMIIINNTTGIVNCFFHCKNIFMHKKHTKIFYCKYIYTTYTTC